VKLTENFSLSEFLPPDMHESEVPQDVVHNLRIICSIILEPLRAGLAQLFGVEVVVDPTSGYRPPGYNELKGGVASSDHKRGLAVDFQVHAHGDTPTWQRLTEAAWKWIAANLQGKFGQLIFEDQRQVKQDHKKLWVHVSLVNAKHGGDASDHNRMLFTFDGKRYEQAGEELFG
jgi:hypothetical protein